MIKLRHMFPSTPLKEEHSNASPLPSSYALLEDECSLKMQIRFRLGDENRKMIEVKLFDLLKRGGIAFEGYPFISMPRYNIARFSKSGWNDGMYTLEIKVQFEKNDDRKLTLKNEIIDLFNKESIEYIKINNDGYTWYFL